MYPGCTRCLLSLMAAPALKITYEEEYYQKLCADKQVQVQLANALKGKCLVAKTAFAQNDIVLSEKKCVAAQNLDDKLENVKVCGNCMRSVEGVLANCLRARRKLPQSERQKLPGIAEATFVHLETFADLPVPVPCAYAESHGCTEQYCSHKCKEEAWRRYHGVLCPKTTGFPNCKSSPIVQMHDESWVQGGINYADTFYVVFIIFAHVLCNIRLNSMPPPEAWLPFSFFISAPWESLSFEYLLSEDDKDDEVCESEFNPIDGIHVEGSCVQEGHRKGGLVIVEVFGQHS